MRRKGERLAGLEERLARRKEPPRKSHLIGVTTTQEEALDAYGRDCIGPDDFIIFLVGVTPERRADDDRPRSEAP